MSEQRQVVPEPGRQIPVLTECDVLVAGAGVSGCAAAVSAARAGAKVVLLERNGILGGVATASLMGSIFNGFVIRSGEIILRGFGGELTDRLIACGGASPHAKHPEIPGFTFDCEAMKRVLIEMCEEAGVQTLTHAVAARPIMDEDRVTGCFFEGKSGRQAVLAGNTVDCTGEADLIFQSGGEIMETFNGSASTLFEMSPVDVDAFIAFIESEGDNFPKGMDWVRDGRQIVSNWRERGVLFMPHGCGRKWEFVQQYVRSGEFKTAEGEAFDLDALGMYCFRGMHGVEGAQGVYINSNFRRPGLDAAGLAAYELQAQRLCWKVGEFLSRRMPGFAKARVVNVGAAVGYRASRKIQGRAKMLRQWMAAPEPVRHPDAVGRLLAALPVPHTEAWKVREFRSNHTTDVPFGVLVPQGARGILCGSGKSVCQEEFILRSMPKCMTVGQAAGVAAAVASRRGIAAGDVDVAEVQGELRRQGVDFNGEGRGLKTENPSTSSGPSAEARENGERRTTDDGRRTTDDRRRTGRVWE